VRLPATAALFALARLVSPQTSLGPARWAQSAAVPVDEVWLSKDWLGWVVWVSGPPPADLQPGQLAAAMHRGDLAQWPLLERELTRLRALVLQMADGGRECVCCGYDPCVETCPIPRLRRGEWLTGSP
jgi:hypothetical protein